MGTTLAYRIVDVFTDRPLAGNGLCVVLDPCPDRLMGPLAREVNLSETTFPTVTGPGAYSMRIFTPGNELPFAGHPSIGTAWVLGPQAWTQTTSGGTVAVTADAHGAVMEQPEPELTALDGFDERVAAALGLPGVEGVWRAEVAGTVHILVPTSAALDELDPNTAAVAEVAQALGSISLAPVRRLDDRTLHVRVFVPVAGIPEDPGTGSAGGPIGVLARRLWGTDADVTIRQGDEMGRPCRLEVHAGPDGVRVGGRVSPVAEGRFLLD